MSRCRKLLLVLAAALGVAEVRSQSTPPPPGTTSPDTQPSAQAPGRSSAPLAAAEAKLDANDYPAARDLLVGYLAIHPGDARALFDLGYLEDAEDQAAAAEADYRRALTAAPGQFESHLALGLLLAKRGSSGAAEARAELESATRLQPDPPNPAAQAQAYRALARLLARSDPGAARQALLGALKLSPETTGDTLLTAEIAEASGDPETAEQAYRGVLAAASTNAGDERLQATTGLAHLLIASGKNAEAETLLRQALAQNAADPVLNTQLARILESEGKPADAVAIVENLHQALPEDSGITRMLADLYTQTGEPGKADSLYVTLLRTPNADAALLAARGDNLIRQKRFADAIPVLEQATRQDARDGAAWSSLAFAASQVHQPQLTLDALAMRSKVMAETPATYFLAATACDTLHQTKRAVDLYKQFLSAAGGKFPDEEWEAKHRLLALAR